MTNAQLKEQLTKRGLTMKKSATKDEMLEKLGFPAKQWKAFRKMKISELKQELKKCNLKTTGNKQELLERLGVPTGFGETSHEKFTREMKELEKKRKRRAEQLFSTKKKKSLEPQDDPNHEEYMEKCCNAPRFPSWNDDTQPAGCIYFPDGSVMEVYRCLACGKIPNRPNAPPIEEFSDDDEDGTSEAFPGSHFNGRAENDCIVQ